MSRFNQKSVNPTLTENKAGGQAYQESPELEFVSVMLTSMVQDQFYERSSDTIKRIEKMIQNLPDKLFAAKASVYARNEFGMRSVSHLAAANIAKTVKGEEWTKRYFNKIVRRVDDMSEILAAYKSIMGLKKLRPIPNAVKKGFSAALGRFDEYQLAKYQGKTKDISLIDIVNLISPKPTAKNRIALQKLVNGELKCTETWNAKLVEAGKKAENETQKQELKATAWKDFLAKGDSIEYFALLRNLRNILTQAPDQKKIALDLLTKPELIRKSLVLPFRFDVAYNELMDLQDRQLMVALTKAAETSIENIPVMPGKTLIVVDMSGSMTSSSWSRRNEDNKDPIDIASLFGAMLYKSNNDSDLMFFANDANYVNLNPLTDLFTQKQNMIRQCNGGGTNFHSIFERANKAYDRIIILSDMQGWVGYDSPNSTYNKYKAKFKCPDCKIYSFDLTGHGTLQFPEKNVYALAGFSDKVFDIMKLLESDKQALVNTINAVQI